ncbi:hypothetical protein [Streptomyces sp. NPDC053048]|uniref:hypothetical protein n=1 Tax=Streptomyces sp. NPDC053048 TaxID=3365694 RepID=UPI0037D6C8EF
MKNSDSDSDSGSSPSPSSSENGSSENGLKGLKSLLGFVSFMLIAGGISCLLHEWLGWFRLFGFLRFLAPDGYEVYSYVVMVVLGIAVGAASESLTRGERRRS